MALAGGGATAAADAGLRLAARPPALPYSAAAAPSRPPPPPRAPPASQPGGDSPTPPTLIPPRGHGPSAHSTYALPGSDGLSGSAPASACSSSFTASAQLLTHSLPASPRTQQLPAQSLRPARSPRLSLSSPSRGSVSLLFPPAPPQKTEGPLGTGCLLPEREGRMAGGPGSAPNKDVCWAGRAGRGSGAASAVFQGHARSGAAPWAPGVARGGPGPLRRLRLPAHAGGSAALGWAERGRRPSAALALGLRHCGARLAPHP